MPRMSRLLELDPQRWRRRQRWMTLCRDQHLKSKKNSWNRIVAHRQTEYAHVCNRIAKAEANSCNAMQASDCPKQVRAFRYRSLVSFDILSAQLVVVLWALSQFVHAIGILLHLHNMDRDLWTRTYGHHLRKGTRLPESTTSNAFLRCI